MGVVGALVAIAGVAIGGYFVSGSSGVHPYTLQETLPEMVGAFGPDARVVESEIGAGTYGYSRMTRNYVHAPTGAESRGAVLTLHQIDPRVVNSLYGKVGSRATGMAQVRAAASRVVIGSVGLPRPCAPGR